MDKNDLPDLYPGYRDNTELSPEDEKLLAELDALDSNAELAVEFSDMDIVHNSALMNKMTESHGHANNVQCVSYMYVINLYEKDAVNSTFKFTRIYEFKESISSKIRKIFSQCEIYHRTTTECFGTEYYVHPHLQRSVFVYDIVVPVGFDIDATHYYHPETITNIEPLEYDEEFWSTEVKDGYFTSEPINVPVLKHTDTTPHTLKTQAAFPEIK